MLQGVIEMYNYLTSVFQEGDKRSALISAIQALHFIRNGVDIISKTPVRELVYLPLLDLLTTADNARFNIDLTFI